MNTIRAIIAMIFALVLQACGGAGIQTPVRQDPTFGIVDQSAQTLVDLYDGVAFTPLASLPSSGNAQYTGYLGATIFNNIGNSVTRIVGTATIDVAFRATSITASGQITDFIDESLGDVSGNLALSSAAIDANGNPLVDPTFTAQASGLLSWPNRLNRQIDIVLEGDARGAGHAALAGEVLGQHSASGGSGAVIGSFILER